MTKPIADTHAPLCGRRRGVGACTMPSACAEFRRQVATMRRAAREFAQRDADAADGLVWAEDGQLYGQRRWTLDAESAISVDVHGGPTMHT